MQVGDVRFRRKQVRDDLGWSDTALKVHLGRLVEMEYLRVHRSSGLGGQQYEYRIVEGAVDAERVDLTVPDMADSVVVS